MNSHRVQILDPPQGEGLIWCDDNLYVLCERMIIAALIRFLRVINIRIHSFKQRHIRKQKQNEIVISVSHNKWRIYLKKSKIWEIPKSSIINWSMTLRLKQRQKKISRIPNKDFARGSRSWTIPKYLLEIRPCPSNYSRDKAIPNCCKAMPRWLLQYKFQKKGPEENLKQDIPSS